MLMLTYTRLMLTYSLSPFERGFPFAWETYKCGRLEILKVLTQALRPLPLYKGTLGHRRCCLGLNFPRDDPHNHGSVLSPYLSSDPLPLSSSCSILSCSCPCLNFPAGCLLRRKKKKTQEMYLFSVMRHLTHALEVAIPSLSFKYIYLLD